MAYLKKPLIINGLVLKIGGAGEQQF